MRFPTALILFLPLATPLTAQGAADRGAYVVRLGSDTVSVETFARSGTHLIGDRVLRTPRVTLLHYDATLGPDGRITRFELGSNPGNRLDLPPLQRATVEMKGDSAFVSVTQGDSTRRYAIAVQPGAVPMLNSTYALYGQMTRQFARQRDDSVTIDQVVPGVLRPVPTVLKRIARDSMTIDYFGNPMLVSVDADGRLLGLSGALTTEKVVVTRQDSADITAIAHAFAAAESASGPVGQMSPRDTTRGTVGSAHLLVDYGRPRMRGRKVFGGIVPFGEVWRTGANAATQFTTDQPIVIGGTPVPAGTYTLWTIPSSTAPVLIINKQTGQWGTDYDPSQDFARIPLASSALDAPVEVFTITLTPRAGGGVMGFEWEGTRWEVGIGKS
jgi:hypothetical protein